MMLYVSRGSFSQKAGLGPLLNFKLLGVEEIEAIGREIWYDLIKIEKGWTGSNSQVFGFIEYTHCNWVHFASHFDFFPAQRFLR